MEARERARKRRAGGRSLAQAETQQIGGAALSEGLFTNPLLRAVLIPLGGTGVLRALDYFGKLF